MSKLVSGRLSANLGYVYENAVAQALTAIGFKLYYHTFKKEGDEKHSYEIDFMTAVGDKVRPIETKSSCATCHRSLDAFMSGNGLKIETPVVISSKNLSYVNGILYLPVYMTQFLDGKDYGSKDVDDSFVEDFDHDDWIPVDDGYILYIKGNVHRKKKPVVSIYVRKKGGGTNQIDASIEVDPRRNIKISNDERANSTVRISEGDDHASD